MSVYTLKYTYWTDYFVLVKKSENNGVYPKDQIDWWIDLISFNEKDKEHRSDSTCVSFLDTKSA